MSLLRQSLTDYLTMRRALGFELYRPGKALENFVRFAENQGASVITTALAMRWATLPSDDTPATWAVRLALVRRFARYCSAIDPKTEVPAEGLLPHRYRRKPPYIYNDNEIHRLMRAAHRLTVQRGLHPLTYETLLGLLATTGMRIGEALALDSSDVDLAIGILKIRNTKFGKTRYVPIHSSTRLALRRYRQRRDECFSSQMTTAFFVNEQGTRLSYGSVTKLWHQLLTKTDIRIPEGQRRPRIHDLRHTFAVRTLLRWYRTGIDVDAHLPRLSTYLGHVHVTDTYWYLSAVPELMQCAVRRLERATRRLPS
jgi:integrase/recombinase XerD